MGKVIESYKIGNIKVKITESEDANRLNVDCNDGNFHSGFTISRYEYKYYKRHMNQKIKNAYRAEYEDENEG